MECVHPARDRHPPAHPAALCHFMPAVGADVLNCSSLVSHSCYLPFWFLAESLSAAARGSSAHPTNLRTALQRPTRQFPATEFAGAQLGAAGSREGRVRPGCSLPADSSIGTHGAPPILLGADRLDHSPSYPRIHRGELRRGRTRREYPAENLGWRLVLFKENSSVAVDPVADHLAGRVLLRVAQEVTDDEVRKS